jgi:hypothetical protein
MHTLYVTVNSCVSEVLVYVGLESVALTAARRQCFRFK